MWFRIVLVAALAGIGSCLALALLTRADVHAEWRDAATAPAPRFEGPGVLIGDRFYVFGGFNDEGFDDRQMHAIHRVDVYDPAADRWEVRGDAPTALSHIMAVADDPYVWIAGGFLGDYPGEAVRDVWRYDTRDDSWEARTPLPLARGGGGLARIGRHLHYFGGYLAAELPDGSHDHWRLDLEDESAGWQVRAPLPETRGHHGVAVVDGRIYAFGGTHVHHPEPWDIRSNVRYDPTLDRWETLAELPGPRSHMEPGTIVLDHWVLMFGGRDNSSGYMSESAMGDVLAYDTEADAFHALPLLPRALRAPIAFRYGDELILSMGSVHGSSYARAETYRVECSLAPGSFCNPETTSARVRVAAEARNVLKRLASVTPWPFGRIWQPLRGIALPYWRDPPSLEAPPASARRMFRNAETNG